MSKNTAVNICANSDVRVAQSDELKLKTKMSKLEELQAEYAAICNREKAVAEQKARVKAEIENLAPDTPEEIEKWNAENGKTDDGSFKMVGTKSWKYSPAHTKLKEDIKILEVEEQESGTASFTEKFGLRFVAKKKD